MKSVMREENGVVVFELSGKIMGETDDTEILDAIYKCADEGKTKVILDLCQVEWMNSRGLGLCIAAATSLRNRGGDLKMACTSGKVHDLLYKSRMFEVFEEFDSVQEAVKSFTQ